MEHGTWLPEGRVVWYELTSVKNCCYFVHIALLIVICSSTLRHWWSRTHCSAVSTTASLVCTTVQQSKAMQRHSALPSTTVITAWFRWLIDLSHSNSNDFQRCLGNVIFGESRWVCWQQEPVWIYIWTRYMDLQCDGSVMGSRVNIVTVQHW